MEIWKDIPGYEKLYQVSNFGRVKSLNREVNNRRSKREGVILKTRVLKYGYLSVGLSKNGLRKNYLVHRLVWSAFKGTIPDDMEINHIDQNPQNCHLDNLNLLNHRDNVRWGDGIFRKANKHKKWVIQLNRSNEILHFYPSIRDAEKETGVANQSISACCKGKGKTAGNYIWKYAE